MAEEPSWAEADERGEEYNPKMEPGYHWARVVKAIRAKGDGSELRSEKGPFLMLVYQNNAEEEATQSLWLTAKAKGLMCHTVKQLGLNITKMDQDGITIKHFENEDFCRRQLEGRECWVRIKHENGYVNAWPVPEEEVPASALQQQKAAPAAESSQAAGPHQPEEDIPF